MVPGAERHEDAVARFGCDGRYERGAQHSRGVAAARRVAARRACRVHGRLRVRGVRSACRSREEEERLARTSATIRPVALALAASLFMAGVIAVARPFAARLPSVVALAMLIALGAAVYGTASLALMPEQVRALRSRLRRR